MDESHFGVTAVVILSLLDQVRVEVQTHIFLEHVVGECCGDVFIDAWIFGGDPHNQIIAITTAASQIQDTNALQSLPLAFHQFVEGRAQKDGSDLILPESSNVVILTNQA